MNPLNRRIKSKIREKMLSYVSKESDSLTLMEVNDERVPEGNCIPLESSSKQLKERINRVIEDMIKLDNHQSE